MMYEGPEIKIDTDAVTAIHGSKLGGPTEFTEPQNPIRSTAAYESDE